MKKDFLSTIQKGDTIKEGFDSLDTYFLILVLPSPRNLKGSRKVAKLFMRHVTSRGPITLIRRHLFKISEKGDHING